MAASGFRKLLVLLWKNFLLKKSGKKKIIFSVLELAMPLVLFVALVGLRSQIKYKPGEVAPFNFTDAREEFFTAKVDGSGLIQLCTHDNEFYVTADVRGVADWLQEEMKKSVETYCVNTLQTSNQSLRILLAENEQTIVDKFTEQAKRYSRKVFGGVVVESLSGADMSYRLRFGYISDADPATQTQKMFSEEDTSEKKRYSGAETVIQTLIDLVFIENVTGVALLPFKNADNETVTWMLSEEALPLPGHSDNKLASTFGSLLSMFTVCAFVFCVPLLLKHIAEEKQSGVKEFLHMMGLPSSVYWTAWFISTWIQMFILVIIIAFLLLSIIESGDFFVIFITFLLYATALILMMFALSTLWNNANLCIACGIIVHFVTFFIPYNALKAYDSYEALALWSKIALCFFPNVAIWWAESGLMFREKSNSKLGFANLSEGLRGTEDDLTLGLVWIMLLADSLIFSFIVFYMDKVKPGPFGTPRPFYFLFTKSYWFGESHPRGSAWFRASAALNDPKLFEPEPDEEPGICVNELRKKFGSVVAVDGVSFNAYPGQITALLGHNGAGKTTTFSMLTGLVPRSGGDALIDGKKLSTELDKIRGVLGLCPQSNMLFDSLTVKEHLFLFGMLKGLRSKEAKSESVRIAHLVRLDEKLKQRSSELSGGMKRKLHLGIAIIGQPRIMLLDEPTSGMDPEARREMWDLLQNLKRDCAAMLLTTHYMEEADMLGDRIALMRKGKIECCGSSLFLKAAYGVAYRLKMTKASNCDDRRVQEFVRTFIPNATMLNAPGPGELSLGLNYNGSVDERNKALIGLLRGLSLHQERLGVRSFGLSAPKLEEVFLSVSSPTDTPDVTQEIAPDDTEDEEGSAKKSVVKSRAVGVELWLMQLKALVTKRAIQTKRQWMLFLLLCLVPIALAAACAAQAASLRTKGQAASVTPPPLTLNLSTFKASRGESYSLVNTGPAADIAQVFKDYLAVEVPGVKIVDTTDFLDDIVKNSGGIEAYGRHYMPSFQTSLYELQLNGTAFNFTEIIVGYNNVPLHGRIMAKNVASNVLFKYLHESNGSIQTSYHPILVDNKWLNSWRASGVGGGEGGGGGPASNPLEITYGTLMVLGFILFTSLFSFTPLKERISNAKQVQIMAGVHPVTFWVGNLLWDLGLFLLVSTAACVLVTAWDDRNLFRSNGAGATLFLILLLYGIGTILMAYFCSFLASKGSSCFTLYITASFFAGFVLALVVWTTGAIQDMPDESKFMTLLMSDVPRYGFSWIPTLPATRAVFALVHAQELNNRCLNSVDLPELQLLCKQIREMPSLLAFDGEEALRNVASCCHVDVLGNQHKEDHICGKVLELTNQNVTVEVANCPSNAPVFTWDTHYGINIDLFYLCGDILLFLLVLLVVEYKIIRSCRFSWAFGKPPNETLDEDVLAEQQAARAIFKGEVPSANVALVCVDLAKNFGSFPAVKDLSFTVGRGECFGLLGVNGAGKTTTFRMLSGDERPTRGNSRLLGKDWHKNKREYLQQIGYCPQFDALIDVLTGREMLNLFASIRGIKPSSERKAEVKKWSNFVGLEAEMFDRACGTYSGGNRRRLNLAQALVGDPPILFLDEPTTGVDPVARRRIWSIITKVTKEGQSVVLTSHSMDEAEALCQNISIMVNGQFQCLGGPQHIKNKFGQGFTVIVKMHRPSARENEDHTKANTGQAFAKEDPEVEAVIARMDKKFQMCTVKERHTDYVHFHIGNPATPWHYLFETMQDMKKQFSSIADFSISETSLEEVFLFFAQKQIKQ